MTQNYFEILDVSFSAGGKKKVNNVNLSIENEGDIVCLLGPSGIGKTTILRTIAGLEKINDGKIVLKNKVLSSNKNHVEPEDRNIALSFQENCLFPHYNIQKNIYLGSNSKRNRRKKINPKDIIKFLNWFSDYNIVPKGMALKLVLLGGKPVKIFEKKFRVILLKKFLSLKFQIAGAMSITPSIGKILFEFIRLKRIAPPMLSPIKYNFFLGYFFFNFVKWWSKF